jgi:hypothetical protein
MRVRVGRVKRLFASSYLSACTRAASTGRIFVEVDTGDLHQNLSIKSKFGYNRTRISGPLRADLTALILLIVVRSAEPRDYSAIVAFPWQH